MVLAGHTSGLVLNKHHPHKKRYWKIAPNL
ncbi:hypothetical protein SR1949_45960 [Sphaerospermopsis reniformis]|uniref:Uncharacterized protein n=1 Tax=Sphaerospermopsis reniformis TaxID=531300 RepID=A0A480A361_9CYAN|nr:hypothetical protein SR1949_45960 [Sphaerospermopsis reniformis]